MIISVFRRRSSSRHQVLQELVGRQVGEAGRGGGSSTAQRCIHCSFSHCGALVCSIISWGLFHKT